MSEQTELSFIKNFVSTLGSQPLLFENDFQQPPESQLKRVPVLNIPVPPPPEHKGQEASSSGSGSADSISITIKSLKPAFTLTLPHSLNLTPTDSISTLKSLLFSYSQQSPPTGLRFGLPPPDAQRLLLKGKVLSDDNKLLREYNLKEGDTLNLMVKPGSGFDWDSPMPATMVTPPETTLASPTPVTPLNTILPNEGRSLSPNTIPGDLVGTTSTTSPSSSTTAAAGKKKGHGRIPSVVLSPSPTSPGMDLPDVVLDGVDMENPTPSASLGLGVGPASMGYRNTVTKPEFWSGLYGYLNTEFPNRTDAATAFEEFLNASKATLTPSEIAKIRDHVGVVGMAGT